MVTSVRKPGGDLLKGCTDKEGGNGADKGEEKGGNEGERGRKCRCICNLLSTEMKWSYNCWLLAGSGTEFQPKIIPCLKPFPKRSQSSWEEVTSSIPGDLQHPTQSLGVCCCAMAPGGLAPPELLPPAWGSQCGHRWSSRAQLLPLPLGIPALLEWLWRNHWR